MNQFTYIAFSPDLKSSIHGCTTLLSSQSAPKTFNRCLTWNRHCHTTSHSTKSNHGGSNTLPSRSNSTNEIYENTVLKRIWLNSANKINLSESSQTQTQLIKVANNCSSNMLPVLFLFLL